MRIGVAPLLAMTLAGALAPSAGRAAPLNFSTLSCARYESELLAAKLPGYDTDPIDTVMWLFGYSVAQSGERVMYGDALAAFGFALDAVCKSSPKTPLLEAVTQVKYKRDNPMDLTRLNCGSFESRHTALLKTDPESANTLTMWLYGYASGMAGSPALDAGALRPFDAGLESWCQDHPGDSVFDALRAPNPALPAPRPGKPKRRTTVK